MRSHNLQILHKDQETAYSNNTYDQYQICVAETCLNSAKQALATLVRLFGDLDLAESTLQESIKIAKKHWLEQEIPSNPQEWLISTAYLNAMHNLRFVDGSVATNQIAARRYNPTSHQMAISRTELRNDQLCLIFLCCHPTFDVETQTALTLHLVGRLSINDIASAFSMPHRVVAQRIMRAKIKIREQCIGYEVPTPVDFLERLNAILQIIHLIFNAGHQTSFDQSLGQSELTKYAIQLCRWLLGLLPEESEIQGLLALMLLRNARQSLLSSTENDLVLLFEHDRSHWKKNLIFEGRILIGKALNSVSFGSYTLLAAIAAVHAEAPNAEKTDWGRIVGLYDLLLRVNPAPSVELNRIIALAMMHGAETGLAMTATLLQRGLLHDYFLLHAARADFFYRLGQVNMANKTYEHALELTQLEPERRFIKCRMTELR